jgi:hypothetical protein
MKYGVNPNQYTDRIAAVRLNFSFLCSQRIPIIKETEKMRALKISNASG